MKKLILTGLCFAMIALSSSCDKDDPEPNKSPAKCMGCKKTEIEKIDTTINIKK